MNVTPEQFEKELEKEFLALHKGICNESQERIIDGAPVDTGALRASIRAGVNNEVVEYSKDETDPTGGQTKSSNESVIREAKLGDTVIITVGAPYGQIIEEGSANRAPTGFVRTVGESLAAIVRSVSSNLGKYR